MREIPSNCKVLRVTNNFKEWLILVTGPEGSLYEKESYLLRLKFPFDYPYRPPSAYFVKDKIKIPRAVLGTSVPSHATPTDSDFVACTIPKHPHIYTNGDICLGILGK